LPAPQRGQKGEGIGGKSEAPLDIYIAARSLQRRESGEQREMAFSPFQGASLHGLSPWRFALSPSVAEAGRGSPLKRAGNPRVGLRVPALKRPGYSKDDMVELDVTVSSSEK
jgi:hypothetical protein